MQSYDTEGRLNQIAVDGIEGGFDYGYLAGTHLQKSLAMPNGVTRTFGYEANRDLLAMIVLSNATDRLVQRDFSYDNLGRLQNRTLFRANETPVAPDAFGYNARSELTNAVIGANTFAYNFDPIGNRLSSDEQFGEDSLSALYAANELNQYTNILRDSASPREFIPEFDADGNQTLLRTSTGIWHVTYNAENRPVLFSNETAVVSMSYDYMGRRFEYKEAVNATLTRHERFLYRGYLQLAALDMLNSGSIKHAIAWDPTEPVATRPLALQTQSGWFTYGFDQVKNVTEMFDAFGNIAATYDYAPFGAITESSGPALSLNPLTFSSEISDTALGLQYYNYRHLNTLDGVWLNRDPIGERGGLLLYGFVDNGGVNQVDVLGLTPLQITVPKCHVILYIGHTSSKEVSITWDFPEKCGYGGMIGCFPDKNIPKDTNNRWPNQPEHPDSIDWPLEPNGIQEYYQSLNFLASSGLFGSEVYHPDLEQDATRILGNMWSKSSFDIMFDDLYIEPCCCDSVIVKIILGEDNSDDMIHNLVNPFNWKPGSTRRIKVRF